VLKQYAPVLYHLINWYSSKFSLSKISLYIYSIIDINIRETFLPRKFPTTRYHLIDIRKVFSLENFPLYCIT